MPNSFKEHMLEGIERGWWTKEEAYERCRDSFSVAAEKDEYWRKEENYDTLDEGPQGLAAFKSMRYS